VWRSGTLPKWAGVVVAPGIVLTMSLSPGLAWAGSVFLVIGGIWLAGRASQAPSAVVAAERAGE